MSVSPQDLEQIVKEVLHRLREREITKEVRAEANGETRDANVLRLDERIVTLAALQDKLSGVELIVVPRGAVLTPSARDEINTRKIKLKFAAGSPGHGRPARRVLLAVTTTYNPVGLFKRLAAAGIQIEQLSAADWKEAVKKMTKELANKDTAGVILTDCPAATACFANRDPAIRAAVAADARSAKDAALSLGANLLVVDPAAHSLYALEKLIREYAKSSPIV